jgi:hypothetical protein
MIDPASLATFYASDAEVVVSVTDAQEAVSRRLAAVRTIMHQLGPPLVWLQKIRYSLKSTTSACDPLCARCCHRQKGHEDNLHTTLSCMCFAAQESPILDEN